MKRPDTLAPGLHCILVRHDDWCPGVHGDAENCICNPVAEVVDEATMADAIVRTGNRAQRRAAARQARRAKP